MTSAASPATFYENWYAVKTESSQRSPARRLFDHSCLIGGSRTSTKTTVGVSP